MHPALCKLFPGFESELKLAGGTVAPPQQVVFRGGGYVKLPSASRGWPVRQLYVSREVLEALLRRMLLHGHRNVSTLHGNAVRMNTTADRTHVESIVIRASDASEAAYPCAILIDASGTANAGSYQYRLKLEYTHFSFVGMSWLKKASYPAPTKITYE